MDMLFITLVSGVVSITHGLVARAEKPDFKKNGLSFKVVSSKEMQGMNDFDPSAGQHKTSRKDLNLNNLMNQIFHTCKSNPDKTGQCVRSFDKIGALSGVKKQCDGKKLVDKKSQCTLAVSGKFNDNLEKLQLITIMQETIKKMTTVRDIMKPRLAHKQQSLGQVGSVVKFDECEKSDDKQKAFSVPSSIVINAFRQKKKGNTADATAFLRYDLKCETAEPPTKKCNDIITAVGVGLNAVPVFGAIASNAVSISCSS